MLCAGPQRWVWVGEDHDLFSAAEDDAAQVGGGVAGDFHRWQVAQQGDGAEPGPGEVEVALQGDEDDEFWEVFDAGAM